MYLYFFGVSLLLLSSFLAVILYVFCLHVRCFAHFVVVLHVFLVILYHFVYYMSSC